MRIAHIDTAVVASVLAWVFVAGGAQGASRQAPMPVSFPAGIYTFPEIATKLSESGRTIQCSPKIATRAGFVCLRSRSLAKALDVLGAAFGIGVEQDPQAKTWVMIQSPASARRESAWRCRFVAEIQRQAEVSARFLASLGAQTSLAQITERQKQLWAEQEKALAALKSASAADRPGLLDEVQRCNELRMQLLDAWNCRDNPVDCGIFPVFLDDTRRLSETIFDDVRQSFFLAPRDYRRIMTRAIEVVGAGTPPGDGEAIVHGWCISGLVGGDIELCYVVEAGVANGEWTQPCMFHQPFLDVVNVESGSGPLAASGVHSQIERLFLGVPGSSLCRSVLGEDAEKFYESADAESKAFIASDEGKSLEQSWKLSSKPLSQLVAEWCKAGDREAAIELFASGDRPINRDVTPKFHRWRFSTVDGALVPRNLMAFADVPGNIDFAALIGAFPLARRFPGGQIPIGEDELSAYYALSKTDTRAHALSFDSDYDLAFSGVLLGLPVDGLEKGREAFFLWTVVRDSQVVASSLGRDVGDFKVPLSKLSDATLQKLVGLFRSRPLNCPQCAFPEMFDMLKKCSLHVVWSRVGSSMANFTVSISHDLDPTRPGEVLKPTSTAVFLRPWGAGNKTSGPEDAYIERGK